MASERQIEANRRNAARSTGPKTDEGKDRSKGNAVTHGLTGEILVVDRAGREFVERRDSWIRNYPGLSEAGRFAFDNMIVATFRIERCARALDGTTAEQSERARLSWESDRGLEANRLASTIARQPGLVTRQLDASLQGVEAKIAVWTKLAESLEAGDGEWSPDEVSTALDLLGVPAIFRHQRAPFDAADPSENRESRRSFVRGEIDRLRARAEGPLAEIDAMDRDHSSRGLRALLSKPAALILRYEREAHRQYNEQREAVLADLRDRPTAPGPESEPAAEAESPEPEPSPTFEAHPAESTPAGPSGRMLNRRQRRALEARARGR